MDTAETNEWLGFVRALYSELTDDELDILVSVIHSCNLLRTEWSWDCCEHRGIDCSGRWFVHQCTELTQQEVSELQCSASRTYSVPGPRSLMHIDTNHKLIRLVVFVQIENRYKTLQFRKWSNRWLHLFFFYISVKVQYSDIWRNWWLLREGRYNRLMALFTACLLTAAWQLFMMLVIC